MKPVKSVLAAVDFSGDATHAAHRAALIASEQRARLRLLHVLGSAAFDDLLAMLRAAGRTKARVVGNARAAMADLAADIRECSGVRATTRVEEGDVLATLLAAAGRADLLVLGARGWNPLRDMILGTTAERLLGMCRQPALVVRRPVKGPYRRAIVAVDFSPHSEPALRMAMDIAPHAEITLVHAFGVAFEGKMRYAGVQDEHLRAYRAQARREALARVIALAAKLRRDDGRLAHAVAHGHAPSLILGKARTLRADLIVIGKHGKSAAGELLLGSVTRHVLSDAKCDVLVVQEPPAGS